MFRLIAYLIASLLVIGIVRAILGVVLKGFADLFRPTQPPPPPNAPRPTVPAAGELKRDPVCGTFVSTSTPFQKKVAGELRYFCSAECRDKFSA